MARGASAVAARATGAQATGAHAGLARALGALAVGAAAFGAVAIGRLAIRRAVIKQLRIEELDVGRLRVRELELESGEARHGRGPARPTGLTSLGATGTKWSPCRERRYDLAALPTGMPRRLLLAAFSAAVIAILIAAPAAFADAFTPESGGSPNADDIDTLYKITLYIGIVIFLLVWGTLIWSLVKYRARRGGRADQIRGNTPLEIGWTVGRRVDPRGPHRGDLPLPRRDREPARLRPERPAARPRRSSPRSTSRIRPGTAGRSCAST